MLRLRLVLLRTGGRALPRLRDPGAEALRGGHAGRCGRQGRAAAGDGTDLRERNRLEDAVDHHVGPHLVGEGVVGQDEAVTEHVRQHVHDVLRHDVVAAADQREGAGRGDGAERRTGRGAVGQPPVDVLEAVPAWLAGGRDDAHHVVHECVVDEHLTDGPLETDELGGVEDLVDGRDLAAHPVDDLPLLLGGRVPHHELEQEAVPLRLGQLVDALALDGVLRRHDEERTGHGVRLPADRHVALGHHLEQRRLHLGGGAVDLVREDEVRHDRAELDLELLPALPVDAGAHEVGGHQVGSELQAPEAATDHRGEGLDGERLGDARHALEQDVPLGEQAHQDHLDQAILTDDHLLDLVGDPLEQIGVGGRPGGAGFGVVGLTLGHLGWLLRGSVAGLCT